MDLESAVESIKERSIRSETKLDSIISWKDRHEDSDEKRFEKIHTEMEVVKKELSAEIAALTKEQTKLMAYGVAAFTVLSTVIQIVFGG